MPLITCTLLTIYILHIDTYPSSKSMSNSKSAKCKLLHDLKLNDFLKSVLNSFLRNHYKVLIQYVAFKMKFINCVPVSVQQIPVVVSTQSVI